MFFCPLLTQGVSPLDETFTLARRKTEKHTQCFKILFWAYNRSKCTFHQQKTNVMIHYPLLFLRSTNKSLISSAVSLDQTFCCSLLIFLSLHSVSSEADLRSLFLQFNQAVQKEIPSQNAYKFRLTFSNNPLKELLFPYHDTVSS